VNAAWQPVRLKLGQVVFIKRHDMRTQILRRLAVSKIGRKWVTLENGERAAIGSRYLDGKGYSCPGTIYLSEEEHDRIAVRGRAWDRLWRDMQTMGQPPDNVSLDAIERARDFLLGKVTQ
jgi:hypothetical protein